MGRRGQRLDVVATVQGDSSLASLSTIIDVHSHPILPFGQGAPVGPGRKQPAWSVESALQYMEEHDISACVLSVPDSANHAPGQEARDIARRINETLADTVSRHPGRFGAVATLPGRLRSITT